MLAQLAEDPVNYRTTFISAVRNPEKLLEKLELTQRGLKRKLTSNEQVVLKKQRLQVDEI